MSHQESKKNSSRKTSIGINRPDFQNHKLQAQTAKNIHFLPHIKQKQYSSSKNLAVSSTCQLNEFPHQAKNSYITQIRKMLSKRTIDSFMHTESGPDEEKYFFKRRDLKTLQFDVRQLKKYSSCNKLVSFPSIPQIGTANDQSIGQNQNIYRQRQIKSSNSIKLQTIQYIKKPKIERIPFKKVIRSNLNKTINPRKIQSENSIQLQYEQKQTMLKKRNNFQKHDNKRKVLVKNPFNRVPKRLGDKTQKQNLRNLQNQLQGSRVSNIFQDALSQSKISQTGKFQIEDLIGYMHC